MTLKTLKEIDIYINHAWQQMAGAWTLGSRLSGLQIGRPILMWTLIDAARDQIATGGTINEDTCDSEMAYRLEQGKRLITDLGVGRLMLEIVTLLKSV